MSELRSRAATRHVAICPDAAAARRARGAVAYDLGVNDLWPAGLDGREAACA